jgi:hypothetical protein
MEDLPLLPYLFIESNIFVNKVSGIFI